MNKKNLKSLIESIIKMVENEDKKEKYISKRLIPAIKLMDEERVGIESRSGSVFIVVNNLIFNNVNWTTVYATPFWEDSDGIPISVGHSNRDRDYEDTDDILPYELTYNLDMDVKNYFKLVYGWIDKHTKKLKIHQHFKP